MDDNADLTSQVFTDTGNAERLVAVYGDDLHYCRARRKWLAWDGYRWCWRDEIDAATKDVLRLTRAQADALGTDEKDAPGRALRTFALASESAGKREAMSKLAQSEPGIPIDVEALDRDPWLFNTSAGTLDLRSGRLREPSRGDLITKLSPVEYVAEPEAGAVGVWQGFIRDVTRGDDELAAYLKRLAGYCLTGCVDEKAFFFLYGPSNGAKSTFVNALIRAWGDYAVTAAFSTWLVQTNVGGNRGDLVALIGARLVTSVETRKSAKFDEEILKRFTGGDPITAAAKYENELTYRPTGKILLAANDAPRAREDDTGFWNRLRRIPFEAKFETVDEGMGLKLSRPEVQQAILAWAVEGCLDWQAERLGTCAAVEASSRAYREESDLYADFFAGCKYEEGARTKTSQAKKLHEIWCRDNGVRVPLGPKALRERFCALGYGIGLYAGSETYRGLVLPNDPERYRDSLN